MTFNSLTQDSSAATDCMLEQAEAAFSAGDYGGARDALQQALTLQPETVEIILFLGNVLFHLGDLAEAHHQFLTACSLEPTHNVAQMSLAAVCLQRHRPKEAEAAIRRVLAQRPNDPAALKYLSGLQLQAGRFHDTLATCAQILEISPNDVDTWLSKGRCHFMLEEISEAVRAYEQVLAINPQNAVAAENLAVVRQKMAAQGRASDSKLEAQGGDLRFAKFRYQSQVGPRQTYQQVKQHKLDLIASVGHASSIRDFGGLWGVHGLYLLQGAKSLQCQFAEMVDVTPIPQFEENIAELRRSLPIQVSMLQGDFRDAKIFSSMIPVDVSLLYEVLLHQDNAVEVIKNVVSRTRHSICVAQPVLKESLFALPNGTVNLQFYPEELKDALRYAGWWEKESITERFTTGNWMWGQTTSYLMSVFHGYAWEPTQVTIYDASEYWNYALIRFTPRATTLRRF